MSSAPPQPADFDRLAFALAQHDRVQAFYPRVEGKASFLFAINIALGGVLAINLDPSSLNLALTIPLIIATASITISLIAVFASFFSHLGNTVHRSRIYFGNIAQQPLEDYLREMRSASVDELREDALCQIWRNAEILKLKFKRVQLAFVSTSFSIPFWLAFLAILTVHTGHLPSLKAG